MRYKLRPIYFKHKYVIHNPYLATIHELHLTLVAHNIDGEAHAVAFIYVSRLGEELDVERQAAYVSCRLRWIVACHTVSCAWIIPLPLLHVAAKLCVRLSCAHTLIFKWWKLKMYKSVYFLVCYSFYASGKHLLTMTQHVGEEDVA